MGQPKPPTAHNPPIHLSGVPPVRRLRGRATLPDESDKEPTDEANAGAASVFHAEAGPSSKRAILRETAEATSGVASYDVGYKKPPKQHQFKKGKSGNPKGRSKDSKNIATILQDEAQKIVVFSENGKQTKASKQELAKKSAMNKAAKGDLKALQLILKLFETHVPGAAKGGTGDAGQTSAASREEMDQAILDLLGLSNASEPDGSPSSASTTVSPEPDQD